MEKLEKYSENSNNLNLKKEIEKIISDGKIDKNEVSFLKEILKNIENVNLETRQDLQVLLSEINNKILYSKIDISDLSPEEQEEIKNLGNNLTETIKNSRNKLSGITGINLSENPDLSTKVGFSLDYISISTTNDNFLPKKGFEGDDEGRSFGFRGETGFSIDGEKYRLNGRVDAFTNGNDKITSYEFVDRNGNLKNKISVGDKRNDVLNVTMTKEIYDEKNERGDEVQIFLGGGVQVIGDLGMDKVQNKWHDFLKIYGNASVYDTEKKKINPVFSADISGKKYILGEKGKGAFVEGNLEADLSPTKKGVSNINARGGIGSEYKKLKTSAGVGFEGIYGGTQSEAITFGNGTNPYAYFDTKFGVKNAEFYLDYQHDLRKKSRDLNNNNQVNVGIKYSF